MYHDQSEIRELQASPETHHSEVSSSSSNVEHTSKIEPQVPGLEFIPNHNFLKVIEEDKESNKFKQIF